MNYREARDIAHVNETYALCFSALGGNSSIDATKISRTVFNYINDIISGILPYNNVKNTDNSENTENTDKNYEKYFKYLEELEEQKKNDTEAASDQPSEVGNTSSKDE